MKRTISTNQISKTPFRLYLRMPRGKSNKPPIYYVQFRSKNSKRYYTSGKSTGTSDINQATMLAWQWYSNGNIPDRINAKSSESHSMQLETVLTALRYGNFKTNELELIIKTLEQVYSVKGGVIPNTSAAVKVKDFMTEFWDYEKSPYLKNKRRSGKGITKSHADMFKSVITKFWVPKFGEREIGSLTKQELQEWLWELNETEFETGIKNKKNKNLSHSYINKILNAGLQALQYAYKNKMIADDCFTSFEYLRPNPKKKGILNLEQARELFASDWNHPTAKLGNQVAMLTGLRLGEILALKKSDIGDDKIFINHNFSVKDGLKCPKNGHVRCVPASGELISALRKQAETNPYQQGDNGYVFWSTTNPDRPFDNKIWRNQLKERLKEMNIDGWEKITFHSWRHFFSTYIEPHLKHSELQKVTGHRTEKMLEHYANHETEVALRNVGKAISDVLLPLAGL